MSAPYGFTLITANKIQNGRGKLLPNGRVICLPVTNDGSELSATLGGGGPLTQEEVTFLVVNGEITTDDEGGIPMLADVTLANPENFGYDVRIVNSDTGQEVQGPGYGCVQPSGATWSFDTFVPVNPPQMTRSSGPAGPAGPAGPSGPTGSVTATGTGGNFSVGGTLTAAQLTAAQVSASPILTTPNQSVLSAEQAQTIASVIFDGPGINLGNVGLWSVSKLHDLSATIFQRGIAQALNLSLDRRALGDLALLYGYAQFMAGIRASSDEGASGINIQLDEWAPYFHGTIASTTGTGDTNPTLAYSYGPQTTLSIAGSNVNVPVLADGSQLLNLSKSTLFGNLNGASTPLIGTAADASTFATFCNSLPVTGVTLPLTTAWGNTTSAIAGTGKTADATLSQTVTVKLGKIGGSVAAFTAGSYVSVAGPYEADRVLLTSVGSVSGNTQTITGNFRYPNAAGGAIFQGGIAGQVISFDANMALSASQNMVQAGGGNLAFTGTLTSGSQTMTAVSSTAGLALGQVLFGTGIPTGTTITSIGSGTLGMSRPASASETPETINVGVSQVRTTHMACGSLTGSDLIYFAVVTQDIYPTLPQTGDEAASNTGVNSGFHLIPAAEIVRNDKTGILPTLAGNAIAWTAGDVVESPAWGYSGGHAIWARKTQNTPSCGQFGNWSGQLDYKGTAITGAFVGLRQINASPLSQYTVAGGPLNGPIAHSVEGYHAYGSTYLYAPEHGLLQAVNTTPGTTIQKIYRAMASDAHVFYYDDSTGLFHLSALAVDGTFTATGATLTTCSLVTCMANNINLTGNTVLTGSLAGAAGAPTLQIETAAGTGASATATGGYTAGMGAGSTNLSGTFSFTTGASGLAAGNVITMLFHGAPLGVTIPQTCCPNALNAAAADVMSQLYTAVAGVYGVTFNFASALAPSTTYQFGYQNL